MDRGEAELRGLGGGDSSSATGHVRGIGRHMPGHQRHRGVLHDARWFTPAVLFDYAPDWIGRVARDPSDLERSSIGNGEVPTDVDQVSRAFAGDRVEILARDVALLPELGVVPAEADDPSSGPALRGFRAHPIRGLGDGSNFREAEINLALGDGLRPFL